MKRKKVIPEMFPEFNNKRLNYIFNFFRFSLGFFVMFCTLFQIELFPFMYGWGEYLRLNSSTNRAISGRFGSIYIMLLLSFLSILYFIFWIIDKYLENKIQ